MAKIVINPLIEDAKKYLVVGESIDSIHSLIEWDRFKLIIAAILLLDLIIIDILTDITLPFWQIVIAVHVLFLLYFVVQARLSTTYIITKFRLIKLESTTIRRYITRKLNNSETFHSFTDIHFEHVETIKLGNSELNATRFWSGLLAISIAWAMYQGKNSFLNGNSPLLPLAIVLFLLGVINVTISFPYFDTKLRIISLSGTKILIPTKNLQEEFIEEIVVSCRTFLSYGAE